MLTYKWRIRILNVICSICLLFALSCESHEKKVDDAFDSVKKSKYELKVMVEPIPKAVVSSKAPLSSVETADEWTVFKLAMETKITEAESQIKQMKLSKQGKVIGSKYAKQIVDLQKRNNDLRRQINDYNEEAKLKFSKFKVALLHDLDEIKLEIRDVAIQP